MSERMNESSRVGVGVGVGWLTLTAGIPDAFACLTNLAVAAGMLGVAVTVGPPIHATMNTWPLPSSSASYPSPPIKTTCYTCFLSLSV